MHSCSLVGSGSGAALVMLASAQAGNLGGGGALPGEVLRAMAHREVGDKTNQSWLF